MPDFVFAPALLQVSKPYKRWRHAIRMLNESRMDWEAAREKAARATLKKATSEGKDGEKEGGEGRLGQAEEDGSQSSIGSQKTSAPGTRSRRGCSFGGRQWRVSRTWTAEVKAAAKELEAAQERAPPEAVSTTVTVLHCCPQSTITVAPLK